MRTVFSHKVPLYLLLFFLLFDSCRKTADNKTKGTFFVTDMAGRKVALPDTICSAFIDRMSVQLVYAFDTIIPVNRVFNYNESEKKYLRQSFYEGKPYCIDDNVEQILRMKPQVMLLCRPLTPANIAKAEQLQNNTNIPVVLFDDNFKKSRQALELMGKVLHKKQKADELVAFEKKYIEPILASGRKRKDFKKIRLYYAEGMKGFNTDPSGSMHSTLIDLVGAKNVAQTNIMDGKGMTAVSPEQIYLWNPDIILVWSGNFDSMDSYKYIIGSSQWAQLKAVREKRVYQVPWKPFGWIDRPPGINGLIGLIWLSHLLYPEEHHFNITAITKEFFSKFYHYEMSDSEVKEIINPKPNIQK